MLRNLNTEPGEVVKHNLEINLLRIPCCRLLQRQLEHRSLAVGSANLCGAIEVARGIEH